MDDKIIYQKIKDIAHRLWQEKCTFTRADLAYELQMSDSHEIDRLVWEAYRLFNGNKVIEESFIDNAQHNTIVYGYQVEFFANENDTEELFSLMHNKMDIGNKAISKLENSIAAMMRPQSSSGFDLLGTIVGTKGVTEVRKEASALFDCYSQLIGNYDGARDSVKVLIADFVTLRSHVCDIYRRYALVLIDAFGDSVKAIAPQLFDFDSIEWLDTQQMLQNVKLDYDQITEHCSILMSSISESFSQSLKQASNSYRSAGSKQAGLLLAGLNMVSHYIDASSRTSKLKEELLTLKNSVKHDVTLVKGDLSRLLVIYKTLNDLFIPQSEAFCQYSDQVLQGEWQQIVDSIYKNPNIQSLKQQRDKILDQCREVEAGIADAETNLAYYTAHIDKCNTLLSNMLDRYTQARESKPKKPLLFGRKRYNREIYEWNIACKPVITRYEDLQTDIKLDNDELMNQKATLARLQPRRQELRQELNRINKRIMGELKVTQATREKILPHLESIVKLLRIAREIAESHLDQKLTKRVTITRQDTELPPDLQQNIAAFANGVRQLAFIDGNAMAEAISDVNKQRRIAAEREQTTIDVTNKQQNNPARHTELSEEGTLQIANAGNVAIQGTINLLEAWGTLQAQRAKSAIAAEKYDQELAKLQEEFRRNIAEIDDKSAILRESLSRINTAKGHEQLKNALLSLAGKDSRLFTDDEWTEFLNGNKTIEL